MRKDVAKRIELYDKYIIEGYNSGKTIQELADELGIKPQKVKYIAHKNGVTKRWKRDNDSFIAEARKIHGEAYDYSKVDYRGNKVKVIITCKVHGDFLQTPHMHISKKQQGCPKCNTSSHHRKVMMMLDRLGVEYQTNDRQTLKGRELDIFIPSKNLAIEVNGAYYHTLNKLGDKYYHYNKFKDCEDLGIRLLQFWDKDIDNNYDLVESMIRNALGVIENRVYARNCVVKSVSASQYADFLKNNHLEGKRNSSIKLGLHHNDTLVAVMGFSKHKDGGYELDRFCSLKDTVVVGAFSKLLKQAPKGKIVSYSFNRYSNGDVYRKNGFTFLRENKTSLFYLYQGEIRNRNQFMKYKLRQKLGVDDNDPRTERELAEELGALQIFDAGTRTWILHNT